MTVLAADHLFQGVQAYDPHFMFGAIIEASPDLIYIYDRLEGRYVFVSERSTALLGYTPRQLLKLGPEHLHRLIHPDDLDQALAHYDRQAFLTDAEISMATYRVRHAAGDYKLIRCRQKVYSRTPQGVAKCILGIGTDITEETNRRIEVDGLRAQICTIRDDERRRIGLQIHDTAMQHVVGAALLLQGIEKKLSTPEAVEVLDTARASLSTALREMLDPFT